MIGSSKDREAIAALQRVVQDLSAQLSSVMSEVKVLAERRDNAVSQANASHGGHNAELQELAADPRAMALMIAANTEQLDVQNAMIAKNEALCNDQIKQCRGMLARLERQAEADLTELRETNAALASVLLRLGANGGSSTANS